MKAKFDVKCRRSIAFGLIIMLLFLTVIIGNASAEKVTVQPCDEVVVSREYDAGIVVTYSWQSDNMLTFTICKFDEVNYEEKLRHENKTTDYGNFEIPSKGGWRFSWNNTCSSSVTLNYSLSTEGFKLTGGMLLALALAAIVCVFICVYLVRMRMRKK